MDDKDNNINPQEDPNNPAHLPVSGEVNAGRVPDDDPLTIDTDEYPDIGQTPDSEEIEQ